MPAITSANPDPSTLPGYLAQPGLVVAIAPTSVPATFPGPVPPRGAVLGQQAGGGYVLCDPNVTPPDGSQVPVAIMATPPDVANAIPGMVYTAGQFGAAYILFHTNWTLPAVMYALRQAGILTFTQGRATGFI